jgi:hypothetical protein
MSGERTADNAARTIGAIVNGLLKQRPKAL